jgi:anti-sigma factor RsiW
MSENPTKAGIPSDLELMLYADGELDADRITAVEAFLARESGARRKLSSLGVVSGIVRERAVASASPADGIADALMAQIAAESRSNGVIHAAPTPVRAAATPIALTPVAPRAAKAANDNSRGIFALAAAAIAAAAALMIWGRATVQPDLASTQPTVQTEARPIVVVAPPAPAKIAEAAVEADGEHGVEVAAVDFGTRMGSIFYVPTGSAASNATTTVVWLNDDAAGER